jgi:hypothetical protein
MAFSVALLSSATRAIGIASRMIYLGGIRNKGPDQTHLDAAIALVCQSTRTVATAPAAACANTIAHGAKKPSLWRPRNAKSASGSKRSRACCAQCTLMNPFARNRTSLLNGATTPDNNNHHRGLDHGDESRDQEPQDNLPIGRHLRAAPIRLVDLSPGQLL